MRLANQRASTCCGVYTLFQNRARRTKTTVVDSKILLCRRWCSHLYIFEDRTPKFCTDLIQCVYTCPEAGILNQTSRSWDNFCNFWTRAQIKKPPRWTLASGLNMNYTKFHWDWSRDELRKASLLPHAFLLSRETSTCVYKRAHKAGFGASKRQRSGPRFANSGTGGTREKMRTVLKTRVRAEKDTIGIKALSRVIRKSVYSPLSLCSSRFPPFCFAHCDIWSRTENSRYSLFLNNE